MHRSTPLPMTSVPKSIATRTWNCSPATASSRFTRPGSSLQTATFTMSSFTRPSYCSANGSAEGIVGAMLDVTHMRGIEADLRTLNQNLETRVAARTGELARANAELERTIDSLSLAQDELGRQERLSSLGSMVAGVAHELNTPIGNSLTVATTLQEAASSFTQEITGGPCVARRSMISRPAVRTLAPCWCAISSVPPG